MEEEPKDAPPARLTGRVAIADLVLDTGTHEVSRNGELIPLPRLSYRLLLALAESAPAVVTHDQLVERVWPGRVISPETITQRIRLLRKALDDDAGSPRYIGLVRSEGYRLLPQVALLGESTYISGGEPTRSGNRRRSRVIWAALGLAAAVIAGLIALSSRPPAFAPPLNTIAVMPFVNAGEPEDYVISAGLGDELRDQLSRDGGLRVAARTSSLRAQAEDTPDVRQMARDLGVRWLVEGIVEPQRITVRLIDGQTGFQHSTDHFERQERDLPAIQQAIARRLVGEIFPAATTTTQPATTNAEANALMLSARHLEQQVRDKPKLDADKLERAISLYRRASRIDPDSALAHSRLAGALLYAGNTEAAVEPIRRAVALNPNLSEVQYNLGLYRWRRGSASAGEAYRRAVELNPDNADALAALAIWEWHQADTERAGELYERALAVDTMSLNRLYDLGNFYGASGRRGETLNIIERVASRFDNAEGYMTMARLYEVVGDLDLAIAWATRALQREPGHQEANWYLGDLYTRLGDDAAARQYQPQPSASMLYWSRAYPELVDLAEEEIYEHPDQERLFYLLAFAYNVSDQPAAAARLLTEIIDVWEIARKSSRRVSAVEAVVTLADSLALTGQQEQAQSHARWIRNFMQQHIDTGASQGWWAHLYQACALAILGEEAPALAALERAVQAPGLAWDPVLRDSPCFRFMQGQPRYMAVTSALDERRRELRRRLPATLASLGVARRAEELAGGTSPDLAEPDL